jgi:putative ABC transport system permease protein
MVAKKYGWKVGDKISLMTEQPRKDGSKVWTFDVVGTFHFTDENMKLNEVLLYGNWEYVEEARAQDAGTVTYYSVKVASPSDVDRVAGLIDTLTANSSHETKSQSENAWALAQLQQFGDLGFIVTSIMGAVFFTLLLLTGHTMMRGVHERIPELAVFKTLGFTGRKILGLVLCESVTVVLMGAFFGLVIATVAVIWVRSLEVLPVDARPSVRRGHWSFGRSIARCAGFALAHR